VQETAGLPGYLGDNDTYLVDRNRDNVDGLKKQYINSYHWRAPENLRFEDRFFDLIHCGYQVEHLQPEDLYSLSIDFNRRLKRGGFLIISTPLMSEGFYYDLSHIKPYSLDVFQNYFGARVSASQSRGRVASNYKMVELQYRYRVVPIPYLSVTWGNRFLKKVAFSCSELLRRLRFGYYESTGYTLVMQKAES
jgi:hypothetical protein